MKKLLSIILLVSMSLAVYAQESTLPFPLLRNSQNPESSAQAGIGLFDSGASTVWENGNGYVGAGYQMWNKTNNFSAEASGRILGIIGLRGRYAQQLEEPYEIIIDDEGEVAGTFKPQSLKASFGISGAIGKHVALGLDMTYGRRVLTEGEPMNIIAFDPAVMVRFAGFHAAVGGRTLGPKAKSASDQAFALPGSAFVAVGYDAVFKECHHIVPSLEFEYLLDKQLSFAGSLCYNWNDMVKVMGGYRYGGVIGSHASLGLGLCIKGVSLAGTYLIGQQNTAMVSLGYRF